MPSTSQTIAASLSIIIGIAAYLQLQSVSKWMDPYIATCTQGTLLPGESYETLLHAYAPWLGGGFVCIITQFLYMLTQSPAGVFAWNMTINVAMPAGIMMNTESGRYYTDGKKGSTVGPVRYPSVIGVLSQLVGISIIFPTLFVPGYVFGGILPSDRPSAIPSLRIIISVIFIVPGIVLTVLLFDVFDPDSLSWTICAGIVGGPIIACLPILLWIFASPPKTGSIEIAAASARSLSSAYILSAFVTFVMYYYSAWAVYTSYEHPRFILAALWGETVHGSIMFMTVDTVVLAIGLLLAILAKGGWKDAIAVLILMPVLGPGGACSIVLATQENRYAIELSRSVKAVKKD